MKFNRGFSLIEVLVTMSIIGLLTAIAVISYGKMNKKSAISWTKAEMTEITRVLGAAKNYDGYYHQFIYAIGYKPKGTVYASVGTDASPSAICCPNYPDPGTSPCQKNYKSGFLYYNCNNSSLNTATDNIEICRDGSYSNNCDEKPNLSSLQTSNFTTCTPMANWCNCNSFTVGAITHFDKELTIDQLGNLCEEN